MSDTEQPTADERKELRRLAEAATPGPWVKGKGSFTVYQGPLSKNTRSLVSGFPKGVGGQSLCACDDLWFSKKKTAQNTSYIAAANPATTLRLLDALDDKDQQILRLSESNELWRKRYDTLNDAYERAPGENVQLRARD